jgi:hypothetical protein
MEYGQRCLTNCLQALRIPRIDFRSLTRSSVSAAAAALVSLTLRTTGPLQADNPAAAAAAGKATPIQLQPGPSGSTASVSALQASTLAGTSVEMVYFDLSNGGD